MKTKATDDSQLDIVTSYERKTRILVCLMLILLVVGAALKLDAMIFIASLIIIYMGVSDNYFHLKMGLRSGKIYDNLNMTQPRWVDFSTHKMTLAVLCLRALIVTLFGAYLLSMSYTSLNGGNYFR